MNCLYEIVNNLGADLKTTNNSSNESNNIIQHFPPGLIIERIDDKEYPDITPNTGNIYYLVRISKLEPTLLGYMLFKTTVMNTPIPQTTYTLLITVVPRLFLEIHKEITSFCECEDNSCNNTNSSVSDLSLYTNKIQIEDSISTCNNSISYSVEDIRGRTVTRFDNDKYKNKKKR